VVHHRGAYLAAIGQALANDIGLHPVYLWTLPMFHCNGWTFIWGVTLQAGTHVCLRRIEAAPIYEAIAEHKVSHLCGAPIVMNLIANAPEEARRPFAQRVQAMTGGAAPPAAVLERMTALGIDMVHFGVLVVVNIMLGLVTPPYGLLLFIMTRIAEVPLKAIVLDVLPFLYAMIAALALITFCPDLVLWLPRLMGYQG